MTAKSRHAKGNAPHPARSPTRILVEGLALLGAGHELIAGGIVDARQNLVDGGQQVAALGQADGDGGIGLGGLKALALVKLDIGQVRVGGGIGLRAVLLGHVAIHRAALHGHDHGGEGLHGHGLVHAGDLVDHGVVEGVELAGDAGAAQILQAGGGGVGAVLLDNHHLLVGAVGSAEIEGGLARLGGAHAGDDGVKRTAHHAHGQAVPFGFDNHKLLAQSLGDALGDLHVVAVGISAAALDGYGVLAGLGLRPVIGRVVALHAHAEGAFRHGRGAGQQHKGRQNDRKNLFHDACSSLLVMKKAANGMRHCRFDPRDMETCE